MITKISVIVGTILLSLFLFDSADKMGNLDFCNIELPRLGESDCEVSEESKLRIWVTYGILQFLVLAFVIWFFKRKPAK